MDDDDVLTQAQRIVDDAGAMEVLGELVRMHAAVGGLLAALEARINAVVAGEGEAP